MTTTPEPRFAKVAAMIGDPTRARMLAALMNGRYMAAGELADAAGVSAQTASGHITKLLDAELVVLRTQGRHRYLRLADAEVGHVLEALSLVAERGADAAKWEQGAYKPLKAARTCYSHLAGELGVALFEGLLARGTLVPCDGHFALSASGRDELQRLGLDVPNVSAASARRFAYACLDWSERRDHLAGALAVALLEHAFAQGWLRRTAGSRALTLTPPGAKALAPWIAVPRGAPGSDQLRTLAVRAEPVEAP
ncbi:MAG TPA: winged helix-turn-helix domain-containing protein [Burkholderiaceae bacterium]|nr:winged helix-turn-helix domain-containing protein [Burkholderiaceae bacterium]